MNMQQGTGLTRDGKATIRILVGGAVASLLTLSLAGCFGEEAADLPGGTLDGMTIVNDENSMKDRVNDRNDTIRVDSSGFPVGSRRAASGKTLTMTLVAEIDPPVLKGDTLQATSVALHGGFAYVSYNYQGEVYRGGVDVIQIKNGGKAELRSQVWFDDADVHALHYEGDLYLATATSREDFKSPAVLERVRVQGGKLELKARERVAIGSFAATSVTVDGKQV